MKINHLFKVFTFTVILWPLLLAGCGDGGSDAGAYTKMAPASPVAGTGQFQCYSNDQVIPCPSVGQAFAGQDATSGTPAPKLKDNGDGTVTDQVTGLMWTRALSEASAWDLAISAATSNRTGGYNDWRLPDIYELYSLINFGRGYFGPTAADSTPFLDTGVFDFSYTSGIRFFDVQLWSATAYVGKTMNGDDTVFGVNFADGRIKGYPRYEPGTNATVPAKMLARYVRGPRWSKAPLTDQGDGTAVDVTSGLLWQLSDDGKKRNWQDALAYCSQLSLAGKTGWRLPHAKELQSIVDYTKSPTTTQTAALRSPLKVTEVESYFWSSTTSAEGPPEQRYGRAVYLAFGRALGWMETPPGSGQRHLLDVHGAGAQRADFKTGDPSKYPIGFGPQGDDVRINMYARCVRSE